MKKIFIIILTVTAAISCTQTLSLENSGEIPLSGGWSLTADGISGTWTATVPCTVAGALYDAGCLPENLFESDNYSKVDRSFFDRTWIWSKNFRVNRTAQHCTLTFDGLDYSADIFLNGVQLASSDTTRGMFIVRSYDVTDILEKDNKLEVRLKGAGAGDLNLGFVDWNPTPVDRSVGIIRPVRLHGTGDVSVEDVYVKPSLDTEGFRTADLEVMVTLRNCEAQAVKGELVLKLEGESECSVPFTLEAGCTSEIILTPEQAAALHIDNPRVWWTWDLGTPELYELTVECLVGEALSDRRSTTFGIREAGSRLTEDGHRQFTLNGRDILVKGAGWTDDIFLRDTHESIALQASYVKDMNLNCIRFENIWGKDDQIYTLCDSLGLLAMVGWSCQWEWESYCGIPEQGRYGCINTPELEDLAVQYFHDQVIRLHNHTSVFTWLTGSDGMPNPELEKRYLEIFNRYDYRPCICSAKDLESVYGGKSGTKMEGPYEYVGPEYWYLDTGNGGAFGFNTETCTGASIPQKENLVRMIPADSLWPISSIWDCHCTSSTTAMNSTDMLENVINGNYGGYDSLDDFLMKAYAVDYNGVKGMFEAFRANIPGTTGIIQWMLNSAWPSLYWQVYDWYGAPTAGYYGVKKACEPLQLIFNWKDRKVYAVNETGSSVEAEATVTIYDENSAVIGSRSSTFTSDDRTPLAVFDLTQYDGKPHFVALSLMKPSGEKVDNFYCIAARDNVHDWKKTNWYVTDISEYADLSFVFSERQAEVTCTVADTEDGIAVTLVNNSGRICPMTILKAKNADGGLVIPAYWSDNFLPLLPGETKTVTCRIDAASSELTIETESR